MHISQELIIPYQHSMNYWVVVPQDRNREDLTNLDGIHAHTALNGTDSHYLKSKANTNLSTTCTKFKGKHKNSKT
jgi:hypothetical protein